MSAQVEDEDTIQPWRQANRFTITTRGHWSGIPEPADIVTLSNYDPYDVDNVAPQIREIASDGNYNTIYDSFYSPVDFQLSGIALKVASFLPDGVQYRVRIKINGSQLELVEIPEAEDHNQKQYSIDCTSTIYEDDFIEIDVQFSGNTELLSFNEHNMVFSISGCMWYGMYKEIYADEVATVATTEEINLAGAQVIDGFNVTDGDIVLVKNQSATAENGLWVISEGTFLDWNRVPEYPDLASLDGIVIHVQYGETQNSTDTTNYVFNAGGIGSAEIPLIEWEEGDKWFKGQVHLQNRSGNEELTDRVIIDSVKATHNFLIQGISISIFNDPLMVVRQLRNKGYCFYVDVLVNGRSILPILNFPRPIPIDPDNNRFKEYDLDVFNDAEGYPVRFGDVINLKIYQQNAFTRTNGKIIQCSLYGCGPDCASLDMPLVAVYEPCADEPCEWKYQIIDKCDPEAAKAARNDPTVKVTTPSLPTERDYITVDGIYVTVNGERTWL
jgi:hypothetical protein